MTVFILLADWTQETLNSANIYSLFYIWEHISTWQPQRQRWREEPHLKSTGNFSCLANSHMCKLLLPRCTFHTFLKNVCFLFTRSRKRMNPKLHCVSQQLSADSGKGGGGHFGLFHLVQRLCPVISFLLKFLLFPVSIYVLTIKKRLPMLSFPQWQWESWPKALAPATTLTNVLQLPVINDYVRFGSEDILTCQRSWDHPTPTTPVDEAMKRDRLGSYRPSWTVIAC